MVEELKLAVMKSKKQEKKMRLIEAAGSVFANKGYAGSKMADIAIKAGIGKGTIYEYFKSKEDLFFEVFEWYFEKVGNESMIGIGVLSGTISKQLETLNNSILASLKNMEQMYGLALEFWAASSSSVMKDRFKEGFRRAYKDYRDIVSSLVRSGMESGGFRTDIDPDSIAAAMVGTWDSLGLQSWFEDNFDLIDIGKQYITVIIRGLSV